MLKCQRELRWTHCRAAYCQLSRTQKRLLWAQEHLRDDFSDVVWTDESTVQLETHRRFCCRKRGQKPCYKPRPKHTTKVHVWAGISYRGSTKICICEGIMDADFYVQILKNVSFYFCKILTLMVTASCKTMTPNILQNGPNNSSTRTALTGRKHLQMQTPSKICDMN